MYGASTLGYRVMKQLLLSILFAMGFSMSAQAVTFDFTGGDHDNPTAGEGGTCTGGGDHCSTEGVVGSGGQLRFEKDGLVLTGRGLEDVSFTPDDNFYTLDDTAVRERVIEDVAPDNGGLGVIGEELGDPNDDDFDPNSFDSSEEQVNAENSEAILFFVNEVVTLGDIEFNTGGHADCTVGTCGTFDLYVRAGVGNIWDLVIDDGSAIDQFLDVTGRAFIFVAAGDTSEWYIGGIEATAVVPEPATWMMMILGFGLIAGQLKRRERMAVELA